MIIAVTGKGGVGKTSISALTVLYLTKKYPDKRVLAIDADPAIGLSTALNIQVDQTIDNIREKFIRTIEGGEQAKAIEMLNEARYEIMDSIVEKDGFAFLAIGRPESAGCYCKVNAFLKDILGMLSEEFDFVVIDGEAGIEQVNRRVIEKVTHLLLVSDASRKGTEVIQTIEKVANELCMFEKSGVLINRLKNDRAKEFIRLGDLSLLGYVHEDDDLTQLDIEGKSLAELNHQSGTVKELAAALEVFGV